MEFGFMPGSFMAGKISTGRNGTETGANRIRPAYRPNPGILDPAAGKTARGAYNGGKLASGGKR